eukprot:5908449-Pyramimonas_sp.AAC.2
MLSTWGRAPRRGGAARGTRPGAASPTPRSAPRPSSARVGTPACAPTPAPCGLCVRSRRAPIRTRPSESQATSWRCYGGRPLSLHLGLDQASA